MLLQQLQEKSTWEMVQAHTQINF